MENLSAFYTPREDFGHLRVNFEFCRLLARDVEHADSSLIWERTLKRDRFIDVLLAYVSIYVGTADEVFPEGTCTVEAEENRADQD